MTPWPSTFLRNLIGPMSKPNQLNDFFRVVKQSVISFIGSDNHVQRKNTLMNQFLFFFYWMQPKMKQCSNGMSEDFHDFCIPNNPNPVYIRTRIDTVADDGNSTVCFDCNFGHRSTQLFAHCAVIWTEKNLETISLKKH